MIEQYYELLVNYGPFITIAAFLTMYGYTIFKLHQTKQGSGGPIPAVKGRVYTEVLKEYIEEGEYWYKEAIENGIAPEQARLLLPAYGMYVRWYWTGSLQSVAHLIKQRTADDAQYEFRLYAEAVRDLAEEHFPVALSALLEGGRG